MGVLSSKNTIRVSELGPERLGLGRFAGQSSARRNLGLVIRKPSFAEPAVALSTRENDGLVAWYSTVYWSAQSPRARMIGQLASTEILRFRPITMSHDVVVAESLVERTLSDPWHITHATNRLGLGSMCSPSRLASATRCGQRGPDILKSARARSCTASRPLMHLSSASITPLSVPQMVCHASRSSSSRLIVANPSVDLSDRDTLARTS